MENQIFNLDKIREITVPLVILQGNVDRLDVLYKKFIEECDSITKNLREDDFINQIQDITILMNKISSELINFSKENISKFLVFQDELIRKYKDSFKAKLKRIKLDHSNLKELGLHLIENKKISKIIDQSSFLFSLTPLHWIDLLDALKNNSLINATIKKVESFYIKLLEEKLKIEKHKIPKGFDPKLLKDFEMRFMINPITFNNFLQEIESKLSREELTSKEKIIEKRTESDQFNKLKEMQEKQLQSFTDYFKLPDKEFKRRMRKNKREKLTKLESEQQKSKKIQIPEEVSEKIEKFKSQFNNSFDEKFLIKKDDEKDPLDLIRARKERKDKEYEEFAKKIKNSEK